MNRTSRHKSRATIEDVIIGHAIKRRRSDREMSQAALAERLNLSTQQVQKYEAGQNRVAATTLNRIAGALNVEVSEFFAELPILDQELMQTAGNQEPFDAGISDE